MRLLISAIATILLTVGCASSGNPPVVYPPQPPPEQAMAVKVTDFVTPSTAVPLVSVTCNGIDRGLTNSEGVTEEFVVQSGVQQDCILTREGYDTQTAGHLPTPTDTILFTWIKQTPPSHPNPLNGRVRIADGCFRDTSGCQNLTYAHAGDLFSLFVRNPQRALHELDKVAAAGYHGVRVWSALGCAPSGTCNPGAYWHNREVGPLVTPDYYARVQEFFTAAAARRLRLVWSQGDVAVLGDRRDAMTRFAALDNAAGGVIDFIDCGNEAWQTGEPDPTRLAACVGYYREAGGQALLTLTSPPGEERHELNAFSIPPADLYDVHGYRGGRFWDKIRHIFSIPYEIKPSKEFGIQSEPFGAGELVSVTDNKHELDDETLAIASAMSAMGKQAWVWFSGEGVKINKGLDTEPGFGVSSRIVQTLLPRDVVTYDYFHHSGTTWSNLRVLVPPVDDIRVDGRTRTNGQTVQLIYGPGGTHNFRVARSFIGEICHPATLACEPVNWTAGSTVTISFNRGRLLRGQAQ